MEGVGINRITANYASAGHVDGALAGDDAEAVRMAHYLLRREGLFIGPSAAMNVVGAVRLARRLGPGHTVATVLCDGGGRYLSKLYSPAWLAQRGLTPPPGDVDDDALSFITAGDAAPAAPTAVA